MQRQQHAPGPGCSAAAAQARTGPICLVESAAAASPGPIAAASSPAPPCAACPADSAALSAPWLTAVASAASHAAAGDRHSHAPLMLSPTLSTVYQHLSMLMTWSRRSVCFQGTSGTSVATQYAMWQGAYAHSPYSTARWNKSDML